MKEILRSEIHTREKSYESLIVKLDINKLVKMTYECYNAIERFTGEIFDGYKWNHFFSIHDLGEMGEKSNYVTDNTFRQKRCGELQKKALNYIETIFKQ